MLRAFLGGQGRKGLQPLPHTFTLVVALNDLTRVALRSLFPTVRATACSLSAQHLHRMPWLTRWVN